MSEEWKDIIKEWSRAAANYAIFFFIYISFQNQLRWCITIILLLLYLNISIVMKCDIFLLLLLIIIILVSLWASYFRPVSKCNWIKMNECNRMVWYGRGRKENEKARRLKKWIERIYYDIKIHNNHLYMSNVFSNNL